MEGTKYPIFLLHGLGIRDNRHLNSWGRIPKQLCARGCRVYQACQDANGSVTDNARVIKARILEVLRETGAEKVNIIAHSKGGLDARYMITHLDMGGRVASLTTVATPHHGSKTLDRVLRIPRPLLKAGCAATDLFMRLLGDRRPKTFEVIHEFRTAQARQFNRDVPDDPRVYYQSYGFYLRHWHSDLLILVPHLAVSAIEGPNDGLLTPDAVRWGNYRGTYCGNGRRGVSHYDEVDLRRRPLTRKTGPQISDIPDFYSQIAADLQKRGF